MCKSLMCTKVYQCLQRKNRLILFQSDKQTLNDEQITSVFKEIIASLEKEFDAVLRN